MKILMVPTSHDKLVDTGRRRAFGSRSSPPPITRSRTPATMSCLPRQKGGQPPLDQKSRAKF